jgi:hypothetical protein
MQEITRSELQALLDEQARSCGRSMVDHLGFRLRSVFALAMSEGVVDRNPASALFTPRHYQKGRSREALTPEQAATLIGALELREKVIDHSRSRPTRERTNTTVFNLPGRFSAAFPATWLSPNRNFGARRPLHASV